MGNHTNHEINIPERSAFYNIEPIGVGTPMVESLTSYISRLAQAHNVSISNMLKHSIFPLLGKKYSYFFKQINNYYNYGNSHIIDGSSSLTSDIITLLEDLTSRNDLSYLTLISWKGITDSSCISRYKKWCINCLNIMKEDKRTFYQPLLWNLHYINFCPIHKIPLSNICPSCNKPQFTLNARGKIVTCYSCNSWLGKEFIIKINNEEKYNDYDIWVSSSIGELLEVTPYLKSFPIKSIGRALINNLENYYSDITVFIDDLLILGANTGDERSEIAKNLLYRLSSLSIESYREEKHGFETLLKFINYIGAPIQMIYDYYSINLSKLPIIIELEYCRDKLLDRKKLMSDFEKIIYSSNSILSSEKIIEITGNSDPRLINLLERLIENNKFLREQYLSEEYHFIK